MARTTDPLVRYLNRTSVSPSGKSMHKLVEATVLGHYVVVVMPHAKHGKIALRPLPNRAAVLRKAQG